MSSSDVEAQRQAVVAIALESREGREALLNSLLEPLTLHILDKSGNSMPEWVVEFVTWYNTRDRNRPLTEGNPILDRIREYVHSARRVREDFLSDVAVINAWTYLNDPSQWHTPDLRPLMQEMLLAYRSNEVMSPYWDRVEEIVRGA